MKKNQKPWSNSTEGFSICGGLVAPVLASAGTGVTRKTGWTATLFFVMEGIITIRSLMSKAPKILGRIPTLSPIGPSRTQS